MLIGLVFGKFCSKNHKNWSFKELFFSFCLETLRVCSVLHLIWKMVSSFVSIN